MIQIKKLTIRQIEELYQKQLPKDFIEAEIKPWSCLERLIIQGNYPCYGLFSDEISTETAEKERTMLKGLAAYAFFIKSDTGKCILLDYYAVLNNYRSSGYGSIFLEKLKIEMQSFHGILFEVESGVSAKSDEERINCERRIKFYERNGLVRLGFKEILAGIDMYLYYLSIHDQSYLNGKYEQKYSILRNELEEIYNIALGQEKDSYVKFY